MGTPSHTSSAGLRRGDIVCDIMESHSKLLSGTKLPSNCVGNNSIFTSDLESLGKAPCLSRKIVPSAATGCCEAQRKYGFMQWKKEM